MTVIKIHPLEYPGSTPENTQGKEIDWDKNLIVIKRTNRVKFKGQIFSLADDMKIVRSPATSI